METTSTQLAVIQSACGELKASQRSFDSLLSMVLAAGNYLNGGSVRGQAYGVKLDVLVKLSTVKSGPDKGTLIHFIAHQAETRNREIIGLSDGWAAMWAASDVSLKQLELDIRQLELQVEKVQSEAKTGVAKVLDLAGEASASALRDRLESFLEIALPRLKTLNKQLQDTDSAVKELTQRFFFSNQKNNNYIFLFLEII